MLLAPLRGLPLPLRARCSARARGLLPRRSRGGCAVRMSLFCTRAHVGHAGCARRSRAGLRAGSRPVRVALDGCARCARAQGARVLAAALRAYFRVRAARALWVLREGTTRAQRARGRGLRALAAPATRLRAHLCSVCAFGVSGARASRALVRAAHSARSVALAWRAATARGSALVRARAAPRARFRLACWRSPAGPGPLTHGKEDAYTRRWAAERG